MYSTTHAENGRDVVYGFFIPESLPFHRFSPLTYKHTHTHIYKLSWSSYSDNRFQFLNKSVVYIFNCEFVSCKRCSQIADSFNADGNTIQFNKIILITTIIIIICTCIYYIRKYLRTCIYCIRKYQINYSSYIL